MIAAPVRKVPSRSGGPATPPSGTSTNTPPFASTARAGCDVPVHADAAAPDGEHPAQAMEQPLPPARGERRRAAPEEPGARLKRQGVEDQERVHPAAVDRRDHEVATGLRKVLAAARRRPGTGTAPKRTNRARRANARKSGAGRRLGRPAEPLEALRGHRPGPRRAPAERGVRAGAARAAGARPGSPPISSRQVAPPRTARPRHRRRGRRSRSPSMVVESIRRRFLGRRRAGGGRAGPGTTRGRTGRT